LLNCLATRGERISALKNAQPKLRMKNAEAPLLRHNFPESKLKQILKKSLRFYQGKNTYFFNLLS